VSVALGVQLAKRMWPVRLYHICPDYLINDTNLEKKLLNIKCVF